MKDKVFLETTSKKIIELIKIRLNEYNKISIENNKSTLLSFFSNERPTIKLNTTDSELYTRLLSIFNYTDTWSKTVNFKDLKKVKQVLKIFIDLNLYLNVRRVHQGKSIEETIPISKVIDEFKNNILLLGGPGAGKTTISQFFCLKLILNKHPWAEKYNHPLVIRFRDFNSATINTRILDDLFINLLNYLGIDLSIHFSSEKMKKIVFKNPNISNEESFQHISNNINLKDILSDEINYTNLESQKIYSLIDSAQNLIKNLTIQIIDILKIVLILEGFDETPSINSYENYINNIQYLINELRYSKVFLTSRTGVINSILENTDIYEIAPLTEEQIDTFVNKWLNEPNKAKDLITQLNSSIYKNTSIRPINIAHLCALYERYGEIPSKPTDVYRKIVGLVTEDWDNQRRITRKSKYERFNNDRKADFLKQLAFFLTIEYGGLIFSRDQLREAYKDIHIDFNLPLDEMDSVINEIEFHTGLLVQSGALKYEFSHKSIQEFLTADALSRIHLSTLDDLKLIELPNELAIATALSFKPNAFFGLLILIELNTALITHQFSTPFLKRVMDEKPDFNDNPILAYALIKLYDFTKIRLSDKKEARLLELDLIEKFIDTHPNIRLSFKNLKKHYQLNNSISLPNAESFQIIKTNGFKEYKFNKMDSSITLDKLFLKLIFN